MPKTGPDAQSDRVYVCASGGNKMLRTGPDAQSDCVYVCASGRQEDAENWARTVRPGENEVVLLPVEATRLYLDLRPFMNVAPLAVRYTVCSIALTSTKHREQEREQKGQ